MHEKVCSVLIQSSTINGCAAFFKKTQNVKSLKQFIEVPLFETMFDDSMMIRCFFEYVHKERGPSIALVKEISKDEYHEREALPLGNIYELVNTLRTVEIKHNDVKYKVEATVSCKRRSKLDKLCRKANLKTVYTETLKQSVVIDHKLFKETCKSITLNSELNVKLFETVFEDQTKIIGYIYKDTVGYIFAVVTVRNEFARRNEYSITNVEDLMVVLSPLHENISDKEYVIDMAVADDRRVKKFKHYHRTLRDRAIADRVGRFNSHLLIITLILYFVTKYTFDGFGDDIYKTIWIYAAMSLTSILLLISLVNSILKIKFNIEYTRYHFDIVTEKAPWYLKATRIIHSIVNIPVSVFITAGMMRAMWSSNMMIENLYFISSIIAVISVALWLLGIHRTYVEFRNSVEHD